MTQDNGSNGGSIDGRGSGTTGRYLVLFAEDALDAGMEALSDQAGIRVERSAAFASAAVGEPEEASEASICFEELGVAVVNAPPDQYSRVMTAASDSRSPITIVEPERIVYAIGADATFAVPAVGGNGAGLRPPFKEDEIAVPDTVASATPSLTTDYLRGYQAAVNHLVDGLLGATDTAVRGAATTDVETTGITWGLAATGSASSSFSGRGIKVAVLDTGMDLHHPDFAGRRMESQSFVRGQAVQDGHGHGTHCIGTACGPLAPPTGVRRYGVAPDATIFAGKVLSNSGRGGDAGILAGINWAVKNGCHVISMSLGARVVAGQGFSQIFETTARRAAAKGSLIIAAAGNDSDRPGWVTPVGHPANCPSIMAVAALDRGLHVASFSNGGINPSGGEVNIAGPGVGVFSSWPVPTTHKTISGTSMATPHVAGVSALFAEATGLRAFRLANSVLRQSRRLYPARDFGWGLVQAV